MVGYHRFAEKAGKAWFFGWKTKNERWKKTEKRVYSISNQMRGIKMQVNLQVPDKLKLSELDVKMSCAAKLYADRKVCVGQAAEIAGLSKRAFIEIMGHYGVSVFDQTDEEIETDCKTALEFANAR
jgi:predicted HTH domain antitoxin